MSGPSSSPSSSVYYKGRHLMDFDLVELISLIQSKYITPTQSLTACFQRIHAYNPHLNAVIYFCEDQAMYEAQQQTEALARGDRVGVLAGCPFAVKDLEDVKGLPTTYGCEFFAAPRQENRHIGKGKSGDRSRSGNGSSDGNNSSSNSIRDGNIAKQDSIHVARLRKAGAIVIGKTNVPIFGSNAGCKNRVYGSTVNPYLSSKTSGGSSGGSASAVAGRLLPFATAADGGGSIRIPASFCGLVGLKPSFGRVPMTEGYQFGMQKFIHCVHFGSVTRTVLDCALHLDVVSGYHPQDPYSLPKPDVSYFHSCQLPLSLGPSAHLPHRKEGCVCELQLQPPQQQDCSASSSSVASTSSSPPSLFSSLQTSRSAHPPAASVLRAGFSLSLGISDVVDKRVQQLLQQALNVIESMGVSVNRCFEVTLPDLSLAWAKMMGVQEMLTVRPSVSNHLSVIERGFTAAWPIMEKVGLEDFAETHRLLFQLNHQLEHVFQQVDLLICPAMPYGAFNATSSTLPTRLADGTDFESPLHPVATMIPFNFSGHPACVIPIGFDEHSLPIAIQLVAPRHRDDLLLQFCFHFEKLRGPFPQPQFAGFQLAANL